MSFIQGGTRSSQRRVFRGHFRNSAMVRRARQVLKPVKRGEVGTIVSHKIATLEEKKYIDISDITTFFNSGYVRDLSPIPQGVSQGQRVGDKVNWATLEFRAVFNLSITTDTSIRCIIFMHKQNSFNFIPTAASPVPTAAYLGSATATSFPYDIENKKNVKILYDSGPMVPRNSSTGSIVIKKTISLKNVKSIFNPATTSGTNKIFLLFYGDGALINACGVAYVSRLWYRDA